MANFRYTGWGVFMVKEHDISKLIQDSADLELVVSALRKTLGFSVVGITLTEFFVKVLNLLHSNNILFAVAGGFARSVYAPYRLTKDIYLSISTTDLKKIDSILIKNGFTKFDELEYNTPAKRIIHKYKSDDKELDLITYDAKFTSAILQSVQQGNLMGHVVNIVSPEMLVLQKMLSFRNKDKADIIEIRDAIKLDMVLIRKWASNLKMFDRLTVFDEEK